MQLAIISLLLFFLVLTQDVKAQIRKLAAYNPSNATGTDTTEIGLSTYEDDDWQTIDIDFLSSYYEQNGGNAAVTGGIGTEHLTDFTQKILIRIPTSPKLALNLDGGYDYYSSASTDRIDNIQSSASSSDVRIHGNIGLTYQLNELESFSARLGGSGEYDYFSVNGGLQYNVELPDRNTAFSFGGQAFFDTWVPIYPVELRGRATVPTDQRRSYNLSMGISRVLTKRMQVSLQVEGIYMEGLLSTPFHRVFFTEQAQAQLENLPNSRLKIPIGVRLNNYLTEWLVARWYYRYYWDDWGIQGHTASIELPVKINRFLSIYPFYRYHTQTAADYFKPYKEHSLDETFYTSDFDLAEMTSHSYGIGMSYSPPGGLAKLKLPFDKRPFLMVKNIDVKYSHYDRSTGLKANIVSLGVGLSF
jgi:hypothetical protein